MMLSSLPYRHLLRPSSVNLSTETGFIKPNYLISFKQEISVKLMTKTDLAIALQWAKKEGWSPGLYELEALYAADSIGMGKFLAMIPSVVPPKVIKLRLLLRMIQIQQKLCIKACVT